MKNTALRTGTLRHGRRLLSLLLMLTLLFTSALPATAVFAAESEETTTLSMVVRSEDGKNYRITANYTSEAGIPENAALYVVEISKEDEAYANYVSQAAQVLGCSIASEDIHLFDISIVDSNDPTVQYQPAEGATVDMKVRLADLIETEIGVIHYGDTAEQIESEASGRTVTFEANGFSVYAFVTVTSRDDRVHTVSALTEMPVYIAIDTDSSPTNTYFLAPGITTGTAQGDVYNRTAKNSTEGAMAVCFEPVAGTDNQFYIFVPGENDTRQYMDLSNPTKAKYVSAPATVFTVSPTESNNSTFYIAFTSGGKTYYFNLRKDDNGKGFNGSEYGPPPKPSKGSHVTFYQYLPSENDIMDLDGKTYGIAWPVGDNTAVVMTATPRDASTLSAISLPMRSNPLHETEDVMIDVGGDIDMFTFHVAGENQYYITILQGGATKYLRFGSDGAVTLEDTPDENAVFVIVHGSGVYEGKLRIKGVASGRFLSLNNGKAANGFSAQNSSSKYTYFVFAEPTNLGDDDFVPYTAIKVSVSDKQRVRNGSQVVVYTRVWNEQAKQYQFYAINHDGSLVRVYDEGDTIRWAGTQINTLLWDFTEYYYWPYFLQIPNYYYELRNTYSGKYIAPQYHTGQILSNRTIGINLNGRRYGDYYSTILAWDDYRYVYAGLKTSADNSTVNAVPMSKAQDFYFAIMDDPVPEEFSTVTTVDNDDHGIRMRLVNFQGVKYDNGKRDRSQTEVMGEGTDVYTGGTIPRLDLVTTDLDENGYPVATLTGKSLQELFGSAQTVNHLFLESIYRESGYFEYNCTQTFATLLNSGDFRVYNQIGTVDTDAPSQGHGWFMPYNDIDPDYVSAYTNVSDVQNNPLPSNDPRLGEQLYGIPLDDAQYHFGMEMEASFIQSKDGLDAWGHDIIFEFTGDDDMWLYIDGELVLDLGGVHSALVGKINFRTGEVSIPVLREVVTTVNGEEVVKQVAVQITTTLREIFAQNYRERNPGATEEQLTEHLDRIFVAGGTVFKDYTSHTMHMFYMERGAGASNLHMRFNLTTAVNGQLLINKEVSGTDKKDYASARFGYQIHYYDKDWAEWRTVGRTEVTDAGKTYYEYNGVSCVNYAATSVPVEYEPSYNGYENVFFLKPGETAEVQFPDDTTEYYITECHVNTSIYDQVSANDVVLAGQHESDAFYYYSTEPEVIGERKVVNFNNHVSQNALRTLTITKKLFDVNNDSLLYPADNTGFRFRVYIGEGNDKTVNGVNYGYYRMDSYYVKDHQGYYCWYNYDIHQFESLGKDEFSQLTAEDLEICTFTTSPSGAIDKIPADHSVEIRNLLIDTKFYIEERESDIPKGYDLIGYERDDGSYLVEEGDMVNSGIIRDNADPHLIVNNHRGWGLTVQKVWSDAYFMLSHDNIYFAVFCNGQLVTDPEVHAVRRMKTQVDPTDQADEAESSLYFYFKHLEDGAEFSDYEIKEVSLTDPVVDENGYVTSYSSMAILGDGVQLVNGGIPEQTGTHATFAYNVEYDVGTPTGPAMNVRTDTVSNIRPGVKIMKVDGNGNPLPGAVFTLEDSESTHIIQSTYTSDSSGLVTYAYPEQGVVYTLTEVRAPDGYTSIINGITLAMDGGTLTVIDPGNTGAVTVTPADSTGMITVTVKNYKATFTAVKYDAVTEQPIRYAHFALYRQVIGKNGPMKDYYPYTGYEDLITDANGLIPGIDGTLPAGTYYLTEVSAPRSYVPLDDDILFSVSESGTVTLLSSAEGETLVTELTAGNEMIVTLKIPNRRTLKTVNLTPQTLVADFGLDINYNVKDNNHLVPEDSAYTYIGITEAENFDQYGTAAAPRLLCEVGTAYEGSFGTLTLAADGSANYQIGSMEFTGEDVFCLVAHVTRISGTDADVYAYEMLTYLPATTIYYEDDFVSDAAYHNGVEGTVTGHDFGKWTKVVSGKENIAQAADLAGSDSANIFGYDPGYTDFATYSNNAAHKVSVADVNSNVTGGGAWPYMEIDFAGTGFDLISVTAGDTGMFAVRVYKTTTDSQGNVVQGSQVTGKAVDTYYGYDYGRLYLDSTGAATLTVTNRPLYIATQDIIEEASPSKLLSGGGRFVTPVKTYYDTAGDITETAYYYDDRGRVTSTVYYVNTADSSDVRTEVPREAASQYVPNYAYAAAEGWVLNTSAAESLYQIPVIRISGLAYGTYRARIEPRFTTRYGHYQTLDGHDYFDLYVDAFRIYDPAGVGDDGTLTSTVIQEAYNYSSEAYEKFTTIKSVIIGAETMGAYTDEEDVAQEGIVLVDGNTPLNSARIDDYAQFGPNNELYLSRDMSVAFEVCASAIPADVQLQMRKLGGGDGENAPVLRITYFDKKRQVFTSEVEIRTATDLSYSVYKLIGKENIQWSPLSDGTYTSGLFIVSNVGAQGSVISLTNLKWTFRGAGEQYRISQTAARPTYSPRSIADVSRVLSFANQDMSVLADAQNPPVCSGGAAAFTVLTSDCVDSLLVCDANRNEVDESLLRISYVPAGEDLRRWTVTVNGVGEEDCVFTVSAVGDGLVSGNCVRFSVCPDPDANGASPLDPADLLTDGFRSFLRLFTELFKKIAAFFNARTDAD